MLLLPRQLPRILLAIMVSATFIPAAAQAAGNSKFDMAAPRDFADLDSERQQLVDVYYGGQKLGEARIRVSGGTVKFDDAAAVAALVPGVASLPDLVQALSGLLPSHAAQACGIVRPQGCGELHPDRAAVIYDEDRFRIEIFVNPALLTTAEAAPAYLRDPAAEPSLVSLFGLSLSGSNRDGQSYHFQNRAIASIGSIRLRSDSSVASHTGLAFDNLTLEADRTDWRYSGGIFWAPGSELVGRRRILGLGLATQLDTRTDKEAMRGTPLNIFLQQPGRVDLLVDGRLMSSRVYPVGSSLVDTTALPDGSYDVVLRIQEDGRPARDERQFFTKGSLVAPLGRPQYWAFAGVLPDRGGSLSFDGGSLFYEAGAAYRLTKGTAVDATLLGTRHKALLESGVSLFTRLAEFRVAALVSTDGDYGAVLRASTVGGGPLTGSVDLRKVKSQDGRPLIPVTAFRGSFDDGHQAEIGDQGSYTQGLATVGYRIGSTTLRGTGVYRRNGSDKADYSLAASIETPIIRTGTGNLLLQADARKSNGEFSSFVGLRFLFARKGLAFSGSAGVSKVSDRKARVIGEAQAAWFQQMGDSSQLSTDAAVGRDLDGTYARGSAYARTPLVNARGDLLHQFGDGRGTTQYAATIDGGFTLSKSGAAIAGRDLSDSALAVDVKGGEPGQRYEVLVDEVVRGTVPAGGHLLLFQQPYRQYSVRIRGHDSGLASFDGSAKSVTLYPGNVARLDWTVTPTAVLFGRAVDERGKPLAFAEIAAAHGIGRTDKDGYFQVETAVDDKLEFSRDDGARCAVSFAGSHPVNGHISAGDVVCR